MRSKQYLLFIFMLVLLSFSCQKNDPFILAENNQTEIGSDGSFSGKSLLPSIFAVKLHWASFITARILYYDETDVYRSDFLMLLNSNENNIIPLDNLLGDDSLLPDFKEAFINLYNDYANNIRLTNDCGRPEGSEDYPRNSSLLESFDNYQQYMLKDNCVEFYFPEGLSFDFPEFTITSLAHPLIITDLNQGLKRYHGPDTCTDIEEVSIDIQYVTENLNVILARPYRVLGPGAGGCEYDEYSFDLTEFLSEE